MAIALVVVIVASLALVLKFDPSIFSSAPPPVPAPPANDTSKFTVSISKIDYTATACWSDRTGPGTTVPGGSRFEADLSLSNAGVRTCVVNAASVTTNGFAIAQQNTPLSVPPGQTGTLRLTIQAPNFDVHQALAITLTVQQL
jgi:hypothetical protein